MKKHISLVILTLIALASVRSVAQNSYYYNYKDSVITFNIDTKKAFVEFTYSSSPQQRFSAITSVFNIDSSTQSNILNSSYNFSVLGIKDSLDEETIINDLANLKANSIILNANPALLYRGRSLAITDKFELKLKDISQTRKLDSLLYTYNDSIFYQEPWDNSIFLIGSTKASSLNSLQQANLFYNSGLFTFSEPDLLSINAMQSIPNDPYFPNQWGLQNTGQSMPNQSYQSATAGVDINVTQAWQITTGDPNISIADLDLGVDLTHPLHVASSFRV